MRPRTILPLSVVAAAVCAASVSAAPDPATGEVSAAAPTTKFSGSITEPTGAVEIYFQEQGTSKGNCEEPVCQEFGLTVKDPGTALTVDSVVDEEGFSQTVEIEDPAGTITQTSASDPGTVKARVRNPKAGAWLIRIYGSDYIGASAASPTWTYEATVTLTPVGGAPPITDEPQTPPPGGGGPGAPPPAEVTLKASAGRLSARSVNRKRSLALKVSASAPVRSLQVGLYTGKASKPRAVGTARAGALNGTRTVRVKLKRKLKAGALGVALKAVDEQGRPVSGRARLSVKR